MKSGWCSSPPGARPHCGECLSCSCSCGCHADQTCRACLAPVLSDTHHETCVAPLDLLCGEPLSTVGEGPPRDGASRAVVCDNGTAALTANKVAPATAAKPPRDLTEPLSRSDPA